MTSEHANDAATGRRGDADDADDTDDAGTDSAADAESVAVDDDDEDRHGSIENTTPPAHDEEGNGDHGDETVPTVELDLYDLSVRVSGQSTDDLDTVGDTAREMMDYLVDRAKALEDAPDDRGLS
jgi:hypothetical protein